MYHEYESVYESGSNAFELNPDHVCWVLLLVVRSSHELSEVDPGK